MNFLARLSITKLIHAKRNSYTFVFPPNREYNELMVICIDGPFMVQCITFFNEIFINVDLEHVLKLL